MKTKVVTQIILALLLINMLTLAWSNLVRAELHDVAVNDVTPSQTQVIQGESLPINVTVENQGDFTETFDVTAYYGNATITAEQWEAFWSMGDVDGDGYIDDTDIDLMSAAYNSTPGDPNWNPYADLNQNLIVDLKDAVTLSTHVGLDIWTYFGISGAIIETQIVNNLQPGSSTTPVFVWNTTGVASGNYIVSAYARQLPGEIDKADNNFADGVVTIVTPEYLTLKLIETIETWDLPQGTENSLSKKLEDALRLLEMGNENGAIHKLMDFIDQVERLREKKLTDEQADYLISEAQRIIGLI